MAKLQDSSHILLCLVDISGVIHLHLNTIHILCIFDAVDSRIQRHKDNIVATCATLALQDTSDAIELVAYADSLANGIIAASIEQIVGERIRRPLQRWNSVEALGGLTPPLGCPDLASEIFVPAVGEGLRIIRSGETNAV